MKIKDLKRFGRWVTMNINEVEDPEGILIRLGIKREGNIELYMPYNNSRCGGETGYKRGICL